MADKTTKQIESESDPYAQQAFAHPMLSASTLPK